MKTKKILEIENPAMKAGQVMFASDNTGKGPDAQYIKIATQDGHFNDFNYGVPAGGSGGSGGSVVTLYAKNMNTSAGVHYFVLYKDMQCTNAVTKEEIINYISNNFLIRILCVNDEGINYWQNISGLCAPNNIFVGLHAITSIDGTNINHYLFFDIESYNVFAG